MPFSRPTLSALQQQAISDITTANLPGISTLLPKSILRVLSYVQAALAWGSYGYIDWISLQSVPFTATGEYLDAWANLKGVYRKAATYAAAPVLVTGVVPSSGYFTLPVGSPLIRGDGFQCITTASVNITEAIGSQVSVQVAAQASTAGSAGNADVGTVLTIGSPQPGVNSTVTAAAAFTGGTDMETDDSLRTRMLQAYSSMPNGGNSAQYVEWALAVPGVTRAWALPLGSGPGSVNVYTMFDVTEATYNGFPQGSNGGATSETRITAATGDQLAVANYIYPLRPATSLVYSLAPTAQPINLTIQNLSPNTTTIQDQISSAIQDLFIREGSPLGVVIYPSDFNAAIESVPGIIRYTLSNPTAPVSIAVGSLPTLGSISFSA